MACRLPTILGKAIEDVVVTLNQEYDEERIVDLVHCIERMEDLMRELQEQAKLRPIIDDGEADVALWNKLIAKYFHGKTFMNAPWLFAEAYKYRRLQECFSVSKYWKNYDVFFRQKCDTFSRSHDAVFELSMRFAEPFKLKDGLSLEEKTEAERLMFIELTQICLWGNSTDLSLLINMTEEQIRSLQSTGGENLAATEKNILGNHMQRLWETVLTLRQNTGGRIDFVLDNAGFELYCDCVYADFLIQSGLAKEIRFHGKRYPWFVSDVTKKDWEWLLNSMVYGHLFPKASEEEKESLRRLGQRWKQYEKEGKWIYEQHPFWCTGFTFWELHNEAPDLFLHLSRSDLVIFKGDLNHRKLTYDCAAPPSTEFEIAIGPMASAAGAPRVCSLRTIKSDVVVGLGPDGDELAERLDKEEPGWKISGKYVFDHVAVLQELFHASEMSLGVGNHGVNELFKRGGAAAFKRNSLGSGGLRGMILVQRRSSCGGRGSKRCIFVKCARDILGSTELYDSMQDTLSDRARPGRKSRTRSLPDSVRSTSSTAGCPVIEGSFGTVGSAAEARVANMPAGLPHAESKQDGVTVVVQSEIVLKVLLPVISFLPERHDGIGRTRDDPGLVTADSECPNLYIDTWARTLYLVLMVIHGGRTLLIAHVPELDKTIARAADQLHPRIEKIDAQNGVCVALEGLHTREVFKVPKLDRLVSAARRENTLGPPKPYAPDSALVALARTQEAQLAAHAGARRDVVDFPDLRRAVLRTGDEQAVVWRDVERVDVLVVCLTLALYDMSFLALCGSRKWDSGEIPHLDRLILAPGEHETQRVVSRARRSSLARERLARHRDGPHAFRVTFAYSDTAPFRNRWRLIAQFCANGGPYPR
ncbi:LOW QUALITY PROTEIN: hypothetical protein ACG7TL_000675 [Trametes sanguinea]